MSAKIAIFWEKMVSHGQTVHFWPHSRVAHVARAALTERSGSSTKGRTPNIRYFDAKSLAKSLLRKPSCFRRAFNKSHPAFVELSTKVILLSKSFQQKWSCFRRALGETAFGEPAFPQYFLQLQLLASIMVVVIYYWYGKFEILTTSQHKHY